jgi:uncharacterized protein (TIGR02596 family)
MTYFFLNGSMPTRRAFTLIEMMVVVALIALITAAVTPMVFGTLVSTRLASAGETLSGQISLAHQMAVSRNYAVEVRFYEYEDPEAPGSGSAFRALAILRASKAGSATGELNTQLTDTYYLPAGIAIGSTKSMSPLLSGNLLKAEADREKIIKRSNNARYKAFQIRPDGTTSLESLMEGYYPSKCYVTLGDEREVMDDQKVPKNFFAVQIDPATGRTTTHRP